MNDTLITVQTTIQAPIKRVWHAWVRPEHIVQWHAATDDWHTPAAENDLRVGGRFTYRMEAKDGSMGFDFEGTYTGIEPHSKIAYVLGDEREVTVTFEADGDHVTVTETFAAEGDFAAEAQRDGWQAILDRFKGYVEGLG